jgi:DHA2 family methylenomycin A resistance protein-like MFS transporter
MKKHPLLTPRLRWFMLAMVLANIANAMSQMLIPIYLTQLGATIGQVGIVFTSTSIAILALQILGGWISDSIGRLRAIALGSLGGVLGFVALLLAPTWQWMLAALVVYQVPFALVGPSFGAFIAENSSEENRGKVYGLTSTIYQVTGVVGPPLGGLLTGLYGFKIMLLMAALFYVTAAVIRVWMATTMRTPEEKAPARLSLASFRSSLATMAGLLAGGGVITWILITDGVSDISFRLSGELQPIYFQQVAGLSIQQIGLLGSIFAVAMMFIPLLSGKLVDRFGERVPIASGFLLIFAALLVFLQAQTFPIFALSWIVFGVGVGLLDPAYQSLTSKVVPAKMLGTFNGVFRGSLGFVSLPAPWLGAQLWERFGPRLPFMLTAAAALLVVPPIWLKFKVPGRPAESEAPFETTASVEA